MSCSCSRATHFRSLAEGNRIHEETIPAPRGILFDRHGTQMVTNQNSFGVAVVPGDLPKPGHSRDLVLARLTQGTGLSTVEVERQLAQHAVQNFEPFVLKGDLDVNAYEYFRENVPEMPGVRLVTQSVRHYVTDSGLAHILGYVGKLDSEEYSQLAGKGYLLDDVVGKTGLEYTDEKWLRGAPGKDVVETDARGHVVRHVSTTDPVPGDNVNLTLDYNLQKQVATELADGIATAKKATNADVPLIKGGAAVVMNPQNGEVYALVSLPRLQPQPVRRRDHDPAVPGAGRQPRATPAQPGHRRPLPAGVHVQAGHGVGRAPVELHRPQFHHQLPGVPEAGQPGLQLLASLGHGNQNVVQAIAHSCDVFFYTVADNIGDLTLSSSPRTSGWASAPASTSGRRPAG